VPVTIIGGSALLLVRMQRATMNAAETTLQNAALVVESAVNRQLLQVDGALVSLPAMFAPITMDKQSIGSEAASRLLRGLNFQTFAFRDIILFSQNRKVWASARPNPWNGNFPVDLLNTAGASLGGVARVEGPARNPVTGDWVLLVIRPVNIPGLGVLDAVAEVPMPLITVLFAAVDRIAGLRISLERPDGQLLLSQPYDETQIGKQQPATIGKAQADGVIQIIPHGPNQGASLGVTLSSLYPDLVISLSLDLKTAMLGWVRDRDCTISVVVFALLLISALALALDGARRQRIRADGERSKARAMLDSAIESMSDAFVMWDADDKLVTCNQQYREMYHISAEFIRPGAQFEDIVRGGALLGQYPQATSDVEAFVQETIQWHRYNRGPMERRFPDGRWALVTERKMPDGGIVGIRTDITELRQALSDSAVANERASKAIEEVQLQNVALRERDRALHIQNVLFDAALNNMSQGLLMTDRDHGLIVYNRRFTDLFAIDPSILVPGVPTTEVFAKMQEAGQLQADVVTSMQVKQRALAEARQSGTFIVSDNTGKSIAVSQRPIADGGWVATFEDVSEQRRAEEHIRFAAHHDALTRLPNRVLFHIRLDEIIGHLATRDGGLALLYLDLDRFKHVNDTLGHPIGDALLEEAAARLSGCLRDADIVARLGGDEFAIAFISNDLPAAAEKLAERIIDVLSKPYNLSGHTVTIGVSVGIALAGDRATDADTLLKNADMAMYQAKNSGRGSCSVFELDMERQLLSRLAIEEDLRYALERDEFELLYQPLWDLSRNTIVGFEALIRWNHPVRGTVSPLQFIHIAEETGLIRSIGAWVLHKACADTMLLPGDIKVAVNLSGAQFDGGNVVEVVAAALQASGLPASRLELEITETTLLQNNESTIAVLAKLHALGLRIALDDFGTGYSSLSYLRTFPFDKIKIDQSFVREMATRSDCAAIVSSIVSLANNLNITTTAEGIETIDQLMLIRASKCTEAQGYLFSVPRPLSDVLDYFRVPSTSNQSLNDLGAILQQSS
jgi:diguanylate cyclase (GGDEF)-like protein